MPRIRSLHPGLFTDERYMALSFPARELIKGIWCEADDQGVFEWKPLTLKARIMPADAVDMSALFVELIGGEFVTRFECEGKSYGAIRNFRKFQRPKKPNATFILPDELVTYVGLTAKDSELTGHEPQAVPHQFPLGGGNPPQMEDEGRRGKGSPTVSNETFGERDASASSSLSEVFVIGDELLAEAKVEREKAGLPKVNLQAERRKYELHNPSKRSREGWLKWALNARASASDEVSSVPSDAPAEPDAVALFWEGFPDPARVRREPQWANRLKSWAERPLGFWDSRWGPKPDHPNCQAPPSMLKWAIQHAIDPDKEAA